MSRSSTPRPAAPSFPIPSPDQPVPPNFLRNQQALLGVAGLVGGVNPSQLAPQPGATASNPIVLDDDDNDQSRSIGRRPLADGTAPSFPQVRGPDILQTLAQQGSALPLVESLVRLLTGTATTAAAAPPKLPGRTGWERASPSEPPPLKRRKLNSVPAGASDWDVPYPFQVGQGPADYQTTWAKERVARLVRELVTLIRDATKKAAVKGFLQEQQRARKQKWMDERGWQGRVGGHYRSKASFYGLEDGLLQARARSAAPGGCVTPQTASTLQTQPFASSSRQTMSEPPSHIPAPPPPTQSSPVASFNQLLASMLASTPPTPQDQDQATPQAPPGQVAPTSLGMLPVPSIVITPADLNTPQEPSSSAYLAEGSPNSQYFDDWLALLEAIPPGDPNDPAALPDLCNVLNDLKDVDSFASIPSTFNMQGQNFDFPDFLDPALLDVPVFPHDSSDSSMQASASASPSQVQTSASASIPASFSASSASHPSGFAQTTSFTQNEITAQNTTYLSPSAPGPNASATPSLTGSPFASTTSLADTEQSPATPEWAWAFGEPGVVSGSVPDGLGITGAHEGGIVVGEAEMKEFEKVLEETCGPLSALSTLRFEQDIGGGDDPMDVDSVGPDASAPVVAQPTLEGVQVPDIAMAIAPAGEPQLGANARVTRPDLGLLQGQQLNGQSALTSQLHAQRATPAPNQPQCPPAGIPGVSSSNATVQNISPSVPPAYPEPLATISLPRSLAPSDVPGQPASHPPQTTATATSQLNALSSLLALTNASKPASTSRLTRAEVLQRAKAMRQDLERARERARVELWETTVEGACLVGLGRELGKDGGSGRTR